MAPKDLWNHIDEDDALEWLGSDVGGFYVKCLQRNIVYCIPLEHAADYAWDELGAVLRVERSPRIMSHIARVVGYYSMLHNWNASKIAELRDRHKGMYDLATRIEPPSRFDGISLTSADMPCLIVAARMCLACHDLVESFVNAGVPHRVAMIDPREGISTRSFDGNRTLAAAALAAFTHQDGTFPALLDGAAQMVDLSSVEKGLREWERLS